MLGVLLLVDRSVSLRASLFTKYPSICVLQHFAGIDASADTSRIQISELYLLDE